MIISILILIFILAVLYKLPFYRIGDLNRFVLPLLFLIKVICSAFVWWYFYHKPGYGIESDLYQFYNVSNYLQDKLPWVQELKVAFGLPVSKIHQTTLANTEYWNKLYTYGFINDNRIMIRINLIMNWFVGRSFFGHSLLFTFLGFCGSLFLLRMIDLFRPCSLYVCAAMLFLLPSTLIWTGSMFKESILLFSIGGLIYFSTKIYMKNAVSTDYLWLFVFSLFLIQTKPLFSILFLYTVLCLHAHSKFNFRRFKLSYLLTFLLPIILIIGVSSIKTKNTDDKSIREGKQFDLPTLLKNKQEDFYFDVSAFHPKTVVPLHRIDGTYTSVVSTIPSALRNMFISPILLSFSTREMIPFALELLMLFSFIIFRLFHFKKEFDDLNNIFFALFITSMMCFLFLGITVPISGLIVKYASPIMPFLFLFIAGSIQTDQIKFKWPFRMVQSK
jgi:hypothetical protein